MWPFTRKPKTDNDTAQYYQGEQRERVGVAWLLAALTLIITVLIVLAVFFGGRWLYRKITHKDNNTATTQTTQTEQESGSSQATQGTSESSGTSSGSNSSSSSSSQGTVTAPTQTNNPSSVSSQPTQTSTPNTGPGDTVAVFVLISVAGYLGYSEYLRRKNKLSV